MDSKPSRTEKNSNFVYFRLEEEAKYPNENEHGKTEMMRWDKMGRDVCERDEGEDGDNKSRNSRRRKFFSKKFIELAIFKLWCLQQQQQQKTQK